MKGPIMFKKILLSACMGSSVCAMETLHEAGEDQLSQEPASRQEVTSHAAAESIKGILFDVGGVLTRTSNQPNIAKLGYSTIAAALLIDRVPVWALQKRIFAVLDMLLEEEIAPYIDFNLLAALRALQKEGFLRSQARNIEMPLVLCAFQAGRITLDQWNAFISPLMDYVRNKNYFIGEREELLIRRSIEGMADTPLDASRNTLDPESSEFVQALKEYKLALLSNWRGESFALVREENSGFFSLFDKIFISSEIGTMKPNRASFEHVFAHYPEIKPHEWIFIDDQIENIEAALKAGIVHAILFENFEQLRQEFNKLGIVVPGKEKSSIQKALLPTALVLTAVCIAAWLRQ